MNEEFSVEVLTPVKQLIKTTANEVVLPAYDGEVGVLASHENFIGLLGTGTLKIVINGDDYWFALSKGMYEISEGQLTILAEHGKTADDIDVTSAQNRLEEISQLTAKISAYDETYDGLILERDRIQSYLDVHRRTDLVN